MLAAPLRFLLGAMAGFLAGLLALAVGLAGAVVLILSGSHVSFERFLVDGLQYLLCFTAGGAVVGLTWPRPDAVWRRRLSAVVGMATLMAGIGVIDSGWIANWDASNWGFWLVSSVVFGFALSIGLERGLRGGNVPDGLSSPK